MFRTKRAYWRKLDNAAKIFPATSGKNDTRVFRFYCELKEMVEEAFLQQALDLTISKYPIFLSIIRKGFFWYYLEKSHIKPIVQKESKLPCSKIFIPDRKSLLFEVTYYKERINFEVFHALTDGTGATQFLKELVKNYLWLVHEKDGLKDVSIIKETITTQDQEDNSFFKYYKRNAPTKKTKKEKIKAYQIHGLKIEYGTMQLTEGILSVQEVRKTAKKYNVSITVFLTSVFLCAIHDDMHERHEKKPVVLMIPVNLRNFFPSESMLNFFGWIDAGYTFNQKTSAADLIEGFSSIVSEESLSPKEIEFREVLLYVKSFFEEELTKERLALRMNELMGLEQNPILRAIPLELKNMCLQAGARLSKNNVTAIFSNMSVIQMPEGYETYIEHFGVFTSTPKTELCMCSFGDRLVLNFTSRYVSVNIQRNFFRILQDIGIETQLPERKFPEEEKALYPGKNFFQWFTFLCIAAAVIAGMVNFMYTPKLHWAFFVSGGILSMWLSSAIGFIKRRNLLKNAMWQLLLVTSGCMIWDLCTGWHGWAVDYILPGTSILIMISMVVITKVQSLLVQDYMIYYVMAAGFGLIPFILILTGVVHNIYLSVFCVGISFLVLVALTIFKRKDLLDELSKKLHI